MINFRKRFRCFKNKELGIFVYYTPNNKVAHVRVIK